jgi:tRNA-dihydrouridine synthase A
MIDIVIADTKKPMPELFATQIALAPMMQRTDRHFRYLLRLLSPDLRLYTEMVTSRAILHGDPERLLGFSDAEHPVALQLGGSDPAELAHAARIGVDFGYDEININIGCPSDRVASGDFGACLMDRPKLVGECVAAINAVTDVPVSVKTRCGIDDHDSYEFVANFIATVADAGCQFFIVHARKAILGGLSPKENRNIPPLRYPMVYQLSDDFPDLRMLINGGIRDTAAVVDHLRHVDGVMIGRQAYKEPYWMAELQSTVLSGESGDVMQLPLRTEIVEKMADYAEQEMARGARLDQISRHMLGLYAGQPGARRWRQFLSTSANLKNAGPGILSESLKFVERAY